MLKLKINNKGIDETTHLSLSLQFNLDEVVDTCNEETAKNIEKLKSNVRTDFEGVIWYEDEKDVFFLAGMCALTTSKSG